MRDLLSLVERQDIYFIEKVFFPLQRKVDIFDVETAGLLKFANPNIEICFYSDIDTLENSDEFKNRSKEIIVIGDDEISSVERSFTAMAAVLGYLPPQYVPEYYDPSRTDSCKPFYGDEVYHKRKLIPTSSDEEYKEKFMNCLKTKVKLLEHFMECSINSMVYCQSPPIYIILYLHTHWRSIDWGNYLNHHKIEFYTMGVICDGILFFPKKEGDEQLIEKFIIANIDYSNIDEPILSDLTRLMDEFFTEEKKKKYHKLLINKLSSKKSIKQCEENCISLINEQNKSCSNDK